jgi:TonB family protein
MKALVTAFKVAVALTITAFSVSASCQVGIEAVSVAALREAGGQPPVITEAPEAIGLADLHARGIQGEVEIAAVITAEGTVINPTIISSSGSQELDRLAIDVVGAMTGTAGTDAQGEPVPVAFQIPLYFWKDSLLDGSLAAKTCRDFVLDADWFLATFPDKNLTDLRVWDMTVGFMFFAQRQNRQRHRPIPDAQQIYETCTDRPNRSFLDVFRDLQD